MKEQNYLNAKQLERDMRDEDSTYLEAELEMEKHEKNTFS